MSALAKVVPWLLVASLALLLLVAKCGPERPQDLSRDAARAIATADSLRTTREAFRAYQQRTDRELAARDTAKRAALAEAERARLLAREQRQRGDVLASRLARDTTPRDSIRTLVSLVDARTAEASSERTRADSLDSVVTKQRADSAALASARDSALARLKVSEDIAAPLVKEIARLRAPCKIPLTFGKVRCLSRTESFVAGIVAGTAVTYVVVRAVDRGSANATTGSVRRATNLPESVRRPVSLLAH